MMDAQDKISGVLATKIIERFYTEKENFGLLSNTYLNRGEALELFLETEPTVYEFQMWCDERAEKFLVLGQQLESTALAGIADQVKNIAEVFTGLIEYIEEEG